MITVWLAPLVCLIGLLVYVLSQGKPSQLGLVAFGCGLLVSLFAWGALHTLTLH